MDAPGEQNGFSDFIELQTGPERRAIDPAVLGEAAVWPLNDGQPNQGSCSAIRRAAREQRGCALDQVTGPHEMITADIIIALDFTPRNAHRCDEGPLKNLVLMG